MISGDLAPLDHSPDRSIRYHQFPIKPQKRQETTVATNPPKGPGRRGAVRDRSQVYNPTSEKWTKRDADTGKFMDQKKDGTPFKGVRKEK